MANDILHPVWYTQSPYEPWDVIPEWTKDYDPECIWYVGTALKYLSRAPYKNNTREDIQKAINYLEKCLDMLPTEPDDCYNETIPNYADEQYEAACKE